MKVLKNVKFMRECGGLWLLKEVREWEMMGVEGCV